MTTENDFVKEEFKVGIVSKQNTNLPTHGPALMTKYSCASEKDN